ncbi:Golgi resident protein GCP60-like [Oculina patagonica]
MADGEPNTEIAENPQDLTITEDQNTSIEVEGAQEKETKEEPYNYGYSLPEYYKLCLQYYHKEKQIIKLTYDDKVQLTAYWKQISSGAYDPEKYPDVGYFDVIGNDRRRAWESLGNMQPREAMKKFCSLLGTCSPELGPWMEAQQKEREEKERIRKEEEERLRREAEEAAEQERQRLLAEDMRRKAEEEERRKQEIIVQQQQQQQDQLLQQQERLQQQQQHQKQTPEQQPKTLAVNGTPRLAPASLWTRPKVQEFIQHVKSDPSSVLVVGRGETMTVRVPTHEGGTCLFWEFATEYYDLGFGVCFEWSQPQTKNITVAVNESDDEEFAEEDKSTENESSPPKPRIDEVLPVVRRPCNEEVIVGSHMYPGRGVYLLKFDNSYSLFRSKTLYYRVYYTR